MKTLLIILALATQAQAAPIYNYIPGGPTGSMIQLPGSMYGVPVTRINPTYNVPLGRFSQRGNQLHHRHANEAAYQAAAARHHWAN